ncbi:unnamed protein product [Linum tenue]|uniref:Maternal effect embryo arrest 59 n=1 Tax=Linum tenue TaxID=586396 RepID=A0AAV0PZD0_9ROSI|nr:unnamed protein product [Linum tenue]
MECCSSRPNRSDAHLSAEQEAEIEQQTRGYFDGVAPKRHTKPQRSDPSSAQYVDSAAVNGDPSIPEYVEFQRLEDVDTQKLGGSGRSEEGMGEEFVETDYYQDLNCVDKQHHTTGTGFIKMEGKVNNFSLAPDGDDQHHASSHRGNPATNEWIPDTAHAPVIFDSDKPRRSDN